MIQFLAKKQKNIALLFITVFYCEILLAGYGRDKYGRFSVANYSSYETVNREGLYGPSSVGSFNNIEEAPSPVPEAGSVYGSGQAAAAESNMHAEEDFTSGPTQPEMQSFQSVNNANMVDLFTGDFSYNIPLMDVGGYPVNISYRSGISMDQEASWVGLGWNINPGTITRNMRGLPDDFNGGADTIRKTSTIRENKTGGARLGLDVETGGFPIGLGKTYEIFHNNYKGWGLETGLHVSLNAGQGAKGPLSGGLSFTNNTQQGVTISPSLSLQLGDRDASEKGGVTGSLTTSFAYNSRSGIKSLDFSAGVRAYTSDTKNQDGNKWAYSQGHSIGSGISPSISFATASYTPSITLPFTSKQVSFTVKAGGALTILHINGSIGGYTSSQAILPADTSITLPAYGYMNYQNGANNPSALLDFNREKEIPYRENPPVPNIAIPSYTYDAFSITGEGTGGMFRAYRGDVGFIYDHFIKTKDGSDKYTLDIGTIPNMIHAGVDLYINRAYTQNSAWINDNPLKNTIAFRASDSTFESVYLRNPGEKSINSTAFYNALGGDDVVAAGLYQPGNNSPYISSSNFLNRYSNKVFKGTALLTPANVVKTQRDKRSQVITYLNAREAGVAGLSKYIESFAYNTFIVDTCNGNNILTAESRINNYRKANHISEIDVLNADGRRYVYGIPVYNIRQKETTFSVDSSKGDVNEGIVKYKPGLDNNAANNRHGNDWYFTSEEMPAYAHSFLLTGVLSPDYVDLTGDGVSDDDLGDAVKFNYTKIAGYTNPYKWRTPYSNYGEATYNEGLRTDKRDDKGSYVYGEKELWYLNSIQSKTMIATFKLEDRKDLLPVDENGKKDTTNNNHNGSKLLREINLYSKADFLKNGNAALPVKTVHFEYTYELCKGVNTNRDANGNVINYTYKDSGKLTLKKIWFTYNGNNKTTALNPYVFNYNNSNPGYSKKYYDRWGNYKDPLQNPGSTTQSTITNAEYPYALQDSTTAASNAAAWTLDSIVLPSAGRIKVTYESDDYAYVQNRRAMQMFNVAGFSATENGSLENRLYGMNGDNLYVFINSAKTLSSKNDIYYKYLQGVQKLYFKLYVKMPSDMFGQGYEYVPCYADIDTAYKSGGYGLTTSTRFWVKLKGISLAGDEDGDYSPLAKAAIQYLRLNLPSKAYPNSEVGDNFNIQTLVKMISALAANQLNALKSYDATARASFFASVIDPVRTFIRLDNPDFKRMGGGLRVKQVTIYDHWNTMTGQKESKYGQQYDYTTIKEVNGIPTRISSGVASYEPMIGGEENPFHLPVRYVEKMAPLAPVTLGYVEEPLGEAFFPSAGVGYSNVRVRSIHTAKRKSANGYEETGFYTAYDFPTIVDNSMIDDNTKKRYKPGLANFLKIDAKHYITLSQGFKIELNDMHGKMKYQATYPETDSANPISYTENFYKVDDQRAEYKHLSNTATVIDARGNVDTAAVIGKDVELMMDMREQQSVTTGVNAEINLDLFVIFLLPIPVPSYIPFPEREEDRYRSVGATKIIQRYGILDSVVHIDKGSIVSTRNLAYDSETGDVLLTRTNNEFNDPLYNFTYPAHWAYSGMGLAYKNINAVFSNITINNGVPLGSVKYPGFKNVFESGDEILVSGRKKTGETTPVNCDGIQSACNINMYAATFDTTVIWAVDAQKINPANTVSLVFIDKDGRPYSGTDVAMKIIRSGKRNMALTTVGSVTSLKNPVKLVAGVPRLVLDSTNNVIATGASVFKDVWKIADIKKSYSIDNSCTCGPLKTLFDYLIASGRLFIQQSDGVTIDSLVRSANKAGYTLSTNDCGILSSNPQKLFYALTSASQGNLYRAQIGNSTVSISSSDTNSIIHFTSLVSNACSAGDNKVYYKDNSNLIYMHRYRVIANMNNATSYYKYYACSSAGGTAQQYTGSLYFGDDVFINAIPGTVLSYNNTTIDVTDEGVSAAPNNTCNSGSSIPIYLSIENCPTCPTYDCYSAVIDTSINPYATGIYGNWRAERAYVYYGQRAEADPSTQTNIRSNGIISSFVPFWSLSGVYMQPSSDTARWVWNARTTLFNKKGYELENTDPLGKYNSGRYAYSNSLPVSVTQNSKYRNQFFDGFEDYYYKEKNCTLCPASRDVDFSQTHGTLDSVNRHSGKYSLKIAAGDSAVINVPITSILTDTASQKVKATIDVKVFPDTIVTLKGTGVYTNRYYDSVHYPTYTTARSAKLQVAKSGWYTITGESAIHIYGGGTYTVVLTVGSSTLIQSGSVDNSSLALTVTTHLQAGNLYNLSLAINTGGNAYFLGGPNFSWTANACTGTQNSNIPSTNIYSFTTFDTTGSFRLSSFDCSKLRGIYTDSTSLLPYFSPLRGTQMWMSAWVKEEQDCLCQNYVNNQVKFVFTDSTGQAIGIPAISRPSGVLIEGWQRYDYTFIVPANAVKASIRLMATGASNVYFDDIRLHPFNANMKSYVYNPVNLRLMAELDENNYATFYEYDDDGTLIRVKKETQRGIQTIKETRSYLTKYSNQ